LNGFVFTRKHLCANWC